MNQAATQETRFPATSAAIGLYEELGFRHRLAVLFAVVRVPRTPPASLGRDGMHGKEEGTATRSE